MAVAQAGAAETREEDARRAAAPRGPESLREDEGRVRGRLQGVSRKGAPLRGPGRLTHALAVPRRSGDSRTIRFISSFFKELFLIFSAGLVLCCTT